MSLTEFYWICLFTKTQANKFFINNNYYYYMYYEKEKIRKNKINKGPTLNTQ